MFPVIGPFSVGAGAGLCITPFLTSGNFISLLFELSVDGVSAVAIFETLSAPTQSSERAALPVAAPKSTAFSNRYRGASMNALCA
jgi:hypothetical protein